MKIITYISILLSLSSCYKKLELDGFNREKWDDRKSCSSYRVETSDLLIKNKELLLESTQNEVESLLGSADEHELYARNQKFFHYRLSAPDSCNTPSGSSKYLSIRFNAIGRANDVQIMVRE